MTITPEQAARRAADGLAPQRDPGRIAPILADLARYWHAHPDMRLGQIVVSAIGAHGVPDVFYPEDDRPAAWLAKATADCPPAPDLRALVEAYRAAIVARTGAACDSVALDTAAWRDEYEFAKKMEADAKAALLAAVYDLACEAPITDKAARATCERLGIDVPKWAAEVRARIESATAPSAASQAERVPCAGWVLRANGRWYLAAGDYEARAVPADVTASPRDLDAGPGRWDVSIPEFGRRRILRTDEGEPDDLAPAPLTPPATLRLAMFAAEDAIAELCTAGLRAIGR